MGDPRVRLVVKVILGFPWDDYGLDEVGEIKKEHADYARALAERIVSRLDAAPAGALAIDGDAEFSQVDRTILNEEATGG